jgi:DNA-binding transcriptional ArsR family regulator
MSDRPVNEAPEYSAAPMVEPVVDASPAYDALASLHVLAGSLPAGRWRAWAEAANRALTDDQRRRRRLWFGGDGAPGAAQMALIPRLSGARDASVFLAALAAIPVGDFLRVAVTAGYTDPDTPLATSDLLALGDNPAEARVFVDRYLRLSGRARSHLLWILAHPEAARAELLDILRGHVEGAFAEIEAIIRDERERATQRLRELLQASPQDQPEWLRRLRDLRGFSPVVIAASAFVAAFSTYYHEIRRPLFDDTAYEPYLALVGARRILGAPAVGRPPADASVSRSDPAERWATLFAALSEPTRLRIVRLLAGGPRYGQELATILGISGATTDHHISQLIRTGIVRVERRAHRTYFVLQAVTLAERLRDSQGYMLGNMLGGDRPALPE